MSIRNHEASAALAALTAAVGTSFASGREIALFFAQTGWTSWIGAATAATAFGGMCFAACRFVRASGARSFGSACANALKKHGKWLGALYGLPTALLAGAMLAACGNLSALALNVRNARWIGMLFALCAALAANFRGGARAIPALGLAALTACCALNLGLAADTRPPVIYPRYETEAALEGNVWAALVLAASFAAMNAAAAAGMIARFSDRIASARRFAVYSGAGLLMLLAAGNAALRRGGTRMLSQAVPMAVLAARWGAAGYWLSIGVMALCCIATLSATMGALFDQMFDRRLRAATIVQALSAVLAALLPEQGRILGFACAMAAGACAAGFACTRRDA